jgi:hypothetical protein
LDKKSVEVVPDTKSNCFWATKYFFEPNSLPPTKMNGIEILNFVAENFTQIEEPEKHDMFIIWSSSDTSLSPDKLNIHFLSTYPEGFPFGLVVEHSGVFLNDGLVFQKASPKDEDAFEVTTKASAFSDYQKLSWVRFTFHRRKSSSFCGNQL